MAKLRIQPIKINDDEENNNQIRIQPIQSVQDTTQISPVITTNTITSKSSVKGITKNDILPSFTQEAEKLKEQAIKKSTQSKAKTTTQETKNKETKEEKEYNKEVFKLAEKNLNEKEEKYDSALKAFQEKQSEEYKKSGIDFQTKFESTKGKKISYQTKEEDKLQTAPKMYDLTEVNKNIEKERKAVNDSLNDIVLAKHQYDSAKVATEDTTMFDKTIGVPIRAIKDLGSILNVDANKYVDENGNEYFLPTYNQLKQEKVSSDYNNKFTKFLGDVGYNTTKILGSTALNTITAGIGGTATYWTDMFTDNFKNVKNQGYDDTRAFANSLVSTGAEYLTGKLIGSATKGLTGGSTSEVSNVISNATNKLVKNPQFSSLVGKAGSEGVEEFLQEYIDNINRLVTLENSTNIKDYVNIFKDKDILEEALYSAGVGAFSGGALGAVNNADGRVASQNTAIFTTFKNQLEEKKSTLTNPTEISKYNSAIQEIDNYINKPFTNNSENLTTDIVNTVAALNLGNNNNKNSIADSVNTFNLNRNNTLENKNNNITVRLEKQIDNAIQNNQSKQKTYLGKANDFVANKIQKLLGIDVRNRTHTLTNNDIRHMIKEHGDPSIEKSKGQIPITKEDIKNIPEIINSPTDIVKGTDNKLGQTIRYIKRYNDNTTYVVEVVPDNSNALIIKTMWKKPSTLTNSIATPSSTSETQGSDISSTSVDNISQNEQNVNFDTSTTNNDMQKSNKNAKNEFYENKIDDDVLVIKDSKNNKENKVTRKNINDFNLEDANTTPNLNKVKVETGNGKSSFYNNITNKTKMLTEENRTKLSAESDIEFYKEVTNKESLDEAYQRLNDGGASETLNWLNKKSEQATATDIAEGWILLKQYQDVGDYDSMVQVAKKMREMGTKAGQTVQAFNIMSRLTPEGMVKYAQSELTEAYNIMVKNKTKEWINKNASNFDLTPQETQFIVDTMKEVATMEDGYNKKVKLAEIQKMLQDKLPPEKGAGIRSWMRISMLFNPKTQVRNVMGNAVIAPVNMVADAMSAFADKQVAKKTGVRTTGITNIKQYGKGFKEGVYQSYNDFKKGINTRDMQGNRFEIGQGKSFKNNNILGKSLNKIDSILNFALDVGDRPFYEAAFTNSINNQLVLNNTTEVTQDMIDIATQEALSRTWQDNNNYTKMVLNIRRNLNFNSNRYGLGDVLIPFAKTPANLTKAIVDYSPAGLVKAILEGNNLKKSLSNGQYDIKQQHKFVQDLGKATAGTMLHVLGFALAKAKITSGENDEDKDVADFMKNTLGIQPYSIKIGNKSFTYDWAQPVAAPFAITANFINNTNEEAKLYEKLLSAMDAGFNLILEQSFMSSIQNVLSNIGGVPEGIMNQILDLPARAVPTFLKQVNDLIDGTTRTSFEKGEPVKTATNKVKSKVPGLSTGLAISRDSLGRKVEKYGGDNNIFNVFLNPANVNKGKESESAKEIYKVYQATGDKTVMPRVTPYSITLNGKTKTLSAEERSEFQKISGEIVEQNVKKLTTNNKYKKLSDEDKAEVIYGIVGFAYNKAKSEVLDTEVSTTYKTANKYVEKGGALYDFYADKVYRNRN